MNPRAAPVWRSYSLAEAPDAHRESEAAHLLGKIVLVPDTARCSCARTLGSD
jgi:hypothetical protein